MRADCTIVTTCCDRLEFLQQALPTWREHTPCPIVVVDYSCPRGTGAWAEGAGATVVQALGKPHFNKPHAQNLGVAAVSTTFTMLLDADCIAHAGFWEWVSARLSGGSMSIVPPEISRRDLTGFLAVETQALRAEPFDERFVSYGFEDIDVRLRLYLSGVAHVHMMPVGLLSALPHSHALRSQHFPEKNLIVSSTQNLDLLARKVFDRTGAPIKELLRDPVAALLLGQGLSAPLA
jgi:hypothetical protein